MPERQRVPQPPPGLTAWLGPVFKTPNLQFIQKCGLDAYFFLRYLRTLLKIFVPASLIALPILLPINATGGGGKQQLNVLNVTNISDANKGTWYWAHLILSICFIFWVCFVVYKELRGYIRVRQAYLTSPQHRIRASATTVLIAGIPRKWLTIDALEGLYDVFPGGIRNIWINRNYDKLATKVDRRNKLAKQLESAETNLIKLCHQKHKKALKKQGKSHEEIGRELTPVPRESSSSQSHTSAIDSARDKRSTSEEHLVEEAANGAVKNNIQNVNRTPTQPPEYVSGSKIIEGFQFWRKKAEVGVPLEYGTAVNKKYNQVEDPDALWRHYLKPKDRETMRLPVVNQDWFPAIPFIGKQVDKIYYVREELARLNLEIEIDQQHPENFPLMSSAFVQFNNQVAAHMACQSVTHHVPQQMTPRMIEISPDDVIWDNMSIKWWESYLRTLLVIAVSIFLVIFYAIPVSFSAALGNLGNIGTTYPGLAFLQNLSSAAQGVIQGIAPPLILLIVLALIPIIYRFLVKVQGVATGSARELGVQGWYFAFLFVQVFLVASIATGLLSFFTSLANDPNQVANTLGSSLPQAANYFLSYITVQALGNSAGALLQTATLLIWFLLAPILDSTPRDKWNRQTNLSTVDWGSFFPPFTNFAVIGIIYSTIAPIIMPFVILIFGLFWIVYRYNVLYVYNFKNDTGGLLFPSAINQLFTGVYFLELVLIGLFFLARNPDGYASAVPQGVIMIVVLVGSIIYQWLLNSTFGPLFKYIPITLEDDAVERDEEFARMQATRWAADGRMPEQNDDEDIQDQLKDREKAEEQAEDIADKQERDDIEARRRSGVPNASKASQDTWHAGDPTRSPKPDRWRKVQGAALQPVQGVLDVTGRAGGALGQGLRTINDKIGLKTAGEKLGQGLNIANEKTGLKTVNQQLGSVINNSNGLAIDIDDPESQAAVGDVLFSGIADELEDLLPEQRDLLVRIAFQHSALRARRPIVWIPRDDLGVSDDEIRRTKLLSEKNLPMSNVGTSLNAKGKVVFEKSPPDFSQMDLIAL